MWRYLQYTLLSVLLFVCGIGCSQSRTRNDLSRYLKYGWQLGKVLVLDVGTNVVAVAEPSLLVPGSLLLDAEPPGSPATTNESWEATLDINENNDHEDHDEEVYY